MAAARKQHRPVCRAFRLFCAAFTCLLLLISSLPAPSAIGAPSKVLRYGAQKTAGKAIAPADMECRKRAVAGKVTPLDGAGVDPACLLPEVVLRVAGAGTVAVIVPPASSDTGRMGTRGARAPPFHFT